MYQKSFTAVLAFALLLVLIVSNPTMAQNSVDLKIDVVDSRSNAVSDAIVTVYYSELLDGELTDYEVSGTTQNTGAFDITLNYSKNSTRINHVFYQVYHPSWSSDKLGIKLEKDSKKIHRRITIPIEFEIYRVSVLNNNSQPLNDVTVQLLSPFFSHKITKSNGIAQFSIPKGSIVNARAEHQYQSKIANFSNINGTHIAYIVYPFEDPKPLSSSRKYSFDMQILDSSSKSIPSKEFFIFSKSESFNLSYLSDSYGFIRAFSIPNSKIVLYWDIGGQTVSKDFDLTNLEEEKYLMDKLLKIHPPKITYIGESCYRVELNITDPHENALKQIDVKVIDGDESIAFTLEQNQIVDHSHILFNRVFCISKNTVFDIIATSPYEQEKLLCNSSEILSQQKILIILMHL